MNPHELAGRGLALEKNRTIDFGRLRLTAPAHPRGAARDRTFNQYLEFAADQVTVLLK